MRRHRIGIDPGVTGCVAILDDLTGEVEFFEAPIEFILDKHEEKIKVHVEMEMLEILQPYWATGQAVIEHQRYYGWGDNAKTLATLCYSYGLWVAYCNALGIPVLKVEPNDWKHRLLGSKNAHKNEAVELAWDLFPKYKKQLIKTKNCRSDALLLIHYGKLLEKDDPECPF